MLKLLSPTALRSYPPGLALVVGIGVVAWALQEGARLLLGFTYIEAIVLAIILGMAWRFFVGLPAQYQPGVAFAAKPVLEFAIVLLGVSIFLPDLLRAGAPLLVAILLTVSAGLLVGTLIGRTLGLNSRLAILIAVGNAICGNSAIAAVAPVVKAEPDDVASAIAVTAVLGILVVLGLPLLIPLLGLTLYNYGVIAGMTVYAVPQVLAATMAVSAVSAQVGTLVKLVRVLLLGPVVVGVSMLHNRGEGRVAVQITRYIPWFIWGFILLAVARSVGLLPGQWAEGLREVSRWLTVGSMAALGLGVNMRALARVGPSVALAVLGSLALMLAAAIGTVFALGIQ